MNLGNEGKIGKKKNLPVGIDNFKSMIQNDYYYFDKTGLIEEVLKTGTSRILFTRPRRFGKTLNISMLKHFFDVRNASENRKLFENLYISKSKYFERQGQNPVIFLTLKDYEEDSWEDGFKVIKSNIARLYTDFKFLTEKMDEIELEEFNNIRKKLDSENWSDALMLLSKYLYDYYDKKVILLIDEYDTPIIKAHENGYYSKAINFFKGFYKSAVKGNDYVEMVVMTGVLRVAKEGIFSGLNNMEVHTILEEGYNEYFGILEEEVVEAIEYYDLDFDMEEVKKWYNGYLFGSINVYNPWSITNFLKFKKLEPHWVNTSSNEEIINYLKKVSDERVLADLEKLFNGGTIIKEVYDFVTFRDIDNALKQADDTSVQEEAREYRVFNGDFGINGIWNFFLHSGYLTVVKKVEMGVYELKIPNEEILSFFERRFISEIFGSYYEFSGLGRHLINGDYEKFGKELKMLLKNSISFRDLKMENSYHLFVIGIISVMNEKYYIKSNLESGNGLPDLVLKPKDKSEKAFIIEFKHSKTKKGLKSAVKEALKQIKEREYAKSLEYENYSNIVRIGMAFWKKDVEVGIEEM